MFDCPGCDDCQFDKITSVNFYEIHVTVITSDYQYFKHICVENNIKPIVIDLHVDVGPEIQVMTSQRITGTIDDVTREIDRIIEVFEDKFQVVRIKVESNPDSPQQSLYYESHLELSFDPKYMDKIRQHTAQHGLHLSRNAFKTSTDDQTVFMATIREYCDRAKFDEKVTELKNIYNQYSLCNLGRVIVEKCIIDNNIDLDKNWIKRK